MAPSPENPGFCPGFFLDREPLRRGLPAMGSCSLNATACPDALLDARAGITSHAGGWHLADLTHFVLEG